MSIIFTANTVRPCKELHSAPKYYINNLNYLKMKQMRVNKEAILMIKILSLVAQKLLKIHFSGPPKLKFSLASPQTSPVEVGWGGGGRPPDVVEPHDKCSAFSTYFKNIKPKVEFFYFNGKLYFISPHWVKRQTACFEWCNFS